MKTLVVTAHPEPKSFLSALAQTAVSALEAQGHTVILSDLYAMGWDAAVSARDFTTRIDDRHLDVGREQGHALMNGTVAEDISSEQRKLADADLVIFHFPMWWFAMPAIMKGWVDRVLSYDFAYSSERKYDTGLMKGKKAMLCLTTGAPSTLYEPNGADGDLMNLLWPIHNGILAYTGFTVLAPNVVWAPASASPEQRREQLQLYGVRLMNLGVEQPLYFHPASDYDDSGRLLSSVPAGTSFQWHPNTVRRQGDSHSIHATRC